MLMSTLKNNVHECTISHESWPCLGMAKSLPHLDEAHQSEA